MNIGQMEESLTAARGLPASLRYLLWRAVASYICAQLGLGIMAVATGVAQAGWVGALLILLLGGATAYTTYLLGAVMLQMDSQDCWSSGHLCRYEDLATAFLGKPGRWAAQAMQWVMNGGSASMAHIVIATNLLEIQRIFAVDVLSKRQLILLTVCVELLPCWLLPSLTETFSLLAFGTVCSLLCGAVVVALALGTDASDTIAKCVDEHGGSGGNVWSFYTDGGGLTLSLNTVILGFGGLNILPNILVELRSRRVLDRVLHRFVWLSLSPITLVYVAVGTLGYYVGGQALASSKVDANILVALAGCDRPIWSRGMQLMILAYALISIHLVMMVIGAFHVCAEMLENTFNVRERTTQRSTQAILLRAPFRLPLVVAIAMIAYSVPLFGAWLDVFAAVSWQGMIYILPVLFYFAVQKRRGLAIAKSHLLGGG
eukprot:CAMPEP_0178386966 /NCGR_PEP_ID=MMETSP0689_2-20121128/8834_1 /TAXON_ID=160604 /ORGANISM="Amphidinium massartii, Strain CS-259" /LENGTH=429 /DNA_ID=CAMNT_0020007323 /DNA_START=1 /DNA_END=1286 /DNA_ORIENTATION=+